jgi:hypothetical protein
MPRVADLGDGVNKGVLPFGPECNVQVDPATGGWVAQTLPVDWNGIPGVLDLYVIPRFEGCREVGEEHGGEEEEHRVPVPVVSHE